MWRDGRFRRLLRQVDAAVARHQAELPEARKPLGPEANSLGVPTTAGRITGDTGVGNREKRTCCASRRTTQNAGRDATSPRTQASTDVRGCEGASPETGRGSFTPVAMPPQAANGLLRTARFRIAGTIWAHGGPTHANRAEAHVPTTTGCTRIVSALAHHRVARNGATHARARHRVELKTVFAHDIRNRADARTRLNGNDLQVGAAHQVAVGFVRGDGAGIDRDDLEGLRLRSRPVADGDLVAPGRGLVAALRLAAVIRVPLATPGSHVAQAKPAKPARPASIPSAPRRLVPEARAPNTASNRSPSIPNPPDHSARGRARRTCADVSLGGARLSCSPASSPSRRR